MLIFNILIYFIWFKVLNLDFYIKLYLKIQRINISLNKVKISQTIKI